MTKTMLHSARSLVTIAAGLLVALPLQAQRFEGTLEVHSSSMPSRAGMQYYIKGDLMRLELSAPGQPSIVMISDGQARKQYVLFADQKIYTTTTFAEVMRSTDSLRKLSANLLKGASMIPSGQSALIAGHKCSVYRYRDASKVYDICLTTELGALGGVGGLFGNIGQSMEAAEPPAWAQKLLKDGSFALRLADTVGNTVWEVRRVEPKTLDRSLFAPPNGFVPAAGPPKPDSER
jgi:hypothetical protein